MKKLLSIAAIMAFAGGTAIAGPAHHQGSNSHKIAPAKQAALVCPVTGTKIPSVAKAVGHTTYKGKTYYFCCSGCKPRFDKDPQHFIDNAAKGKFEKM